MNLYSASREWGARPNDECFWNLKELKDVLEKKRARQKEGTIDYVNMAIVDQAGTDNIALQLPNGATANLNNWSFAQLCQRLDTPTDFCNKLSPKLVVTVLREKLYGLLKNESTPRSEDDWDDFGDVVEKTDDDKSMKLLLYKDDNEVIHTESITSEAYARKFNLGIVETVMKFESAGWRNPPARPANVNSGRTRLATAEDVLQNQGGNAGGLIIKEGDVSGPAGIYCGQQDLFLFMVNDKLVIDGGLKRGFFLQNSEVGKTGKLKAVFFLYESVCGNHIVWGASGVTKVERIHKRSSMKGFDQELETQLETYEKAPLVENTLIARAKKFSLGKNEDEVIDCLWKAKSDIGGNVISKKLLKRAYEEAVKWEPTAQAPPTSAWGFTHGFTRMSQLAVNADKRTMLDSIGGKILDLVPKNFGATSVNVPATI